jgi:uncharacterized repeat protein (TIGR03803 family)
MRPDVRAYPIAAAAVLLALPAAGQVSFSTLYRSSGWWATGLTAINGTLYGVGPEAQGCGAVFTVEPPSANAGEWTENLIYTFAPANDACYPAFGPVQGSDGALFGISVTGGAYDEGAVYELLPPASPGGSWMESLVYSLPGSLSGLVGGPDGSFYILIPGGANAGGALLQLLPSASPGDVWTGAELYSFPGGSGLVLPDSLIAGGHGELYGTTEFGGSPQQLGEVFQLSPPTTSGGEWTYTALHNFNFGDGQAGNPNSLARASDGTLYGTTYGASYNGGRGTGAIFELTPPASPGGHWNFSILENFGGLHPSSPIVLRNGDLYTTADSQLGGDVFELQPPSNAGGSWTTIYLHGFNDRLVPFGQLVVDQSGTVYGATGTLSGAPYSGTIYRIAPN